MLKKLFNELGGVLVNNPEINMDSPFVREFLATLDKCCAEPDIQTFRKKVLLALGELSIRIWEKFSNDS
jgi:hypothetical protein